MSQVIRISDRLYKRLEAHASGFDSPSNVIEKILDTFERIVPNSNTEGSSDIAQEIKQADELEIQYLTDSEDEFKRQLLEYKKAYIKIYYTNNTSEIKEWNAARFSESSKVDGNLRSGYLRGWKERGIYRAELSIDRNQLI